MNERFDRGWGFAPFVVSDDYLKWREEEIKYSDIQSIDYQPATPTILTNAVVVIITKDGKKRQFVYAYKDKERGAMAFRFVEEKLKEANGGSAAFEKFEGVQTNTIEGNGVKVIRHKVDPLRVFLGLIGLVGAILLIIGIIQEYKFRDSVDTSQLTSQGIKLIRSLSEYKNSITFIIIGAVMIGLSAVAIFMFNYYTKNIKKKVE